jgi:AcrR family transcriptional regulator
MDYSAGIIYHYFENKEQIIICILQEGYRRIVTSIKPPDDSLPIHEKIRASLIGYMEGALKWSEEYKAVMLSSSPHILDFTSVLSEGMCEKRSALMQLVSDLELGVSSGLFSPCDTQLTAQAIWSAAFGLLIRLTIERDVSKEQQAKLMHRQIDIILKGLSL